MKINQVRTGNILLIIILSFAGQSNYLFYIAVMQLSLEILNRQGAYLQQHYKFYNFIFWSYGLVLLERLRVAHFSEQGEWLINCIEHLVFGLVICLKIYIYTAILGSKNNIPRWERALLAFWVFNIVGLANEFFQNRLTGRSLFVLIPDSIKDIKMNLLGAVIFALAVSYRIYSIQNKRREI